MNKKNLLVVALVCFCLVGTLFVAVPALAGAPPFDLYAAVRDIQNKSTWILGNLTNAIPQLTTLQNALTDIEVKLWSGSDSVMNKLGTVGSSVASVVDMLTNGGSFYEFVNTWFWNIDHEISDVENKVDSIQQQTGSGLQVVYVKSGQIITDENVEKILLRVRTNVTCQVTLTLWARFNWDKDDYVEVFADGAVWQKPIYYEDGYTSDLGTKDVMTSLTFATNSTQIQFKNEDGWTGIYFHIIAVGPPNTVITQYLSDYPGNVTDN